LTSVAVFSQEFQRANYLPLVEKQPKHLPFIFFNIAEKQLVDQLVIRVGP